PAVQGFEFSEMGGKLTNIFCYGFKMLLISRKFKPAYVVKRGLRKKIGVYIYSIPFPSFKSIIKQRKIPRSFCITHIVFEHADTGKGHAAFFHQPKPGVDFCFGLSGLNKNFSSYDMFFIYSGLPGS